MDYYEEFSILLLTNHPILLKIYAFEVDNNVKYFMNTRTFMAKAFTELHACHLNLSVVFAGNHKRSCDWTYPFFAAITAQHEDTLHRKVSEVFARFCTPFEAYGQNISI